MARIEGLASQGKLTALSEGLWGAIYKLDGHDRVLKVPRDPSHGLHIIEKMIYERLGEHTFIAQFYGEMEIPDEKKSGLLLQYYRHGSLKDYFSSLEAFGHPPGLQQKKRSVSVS
jgi:hypothetical protein